MSEARAKRILIIEDDCDIAEIERDFLEINGFAVAHETEGRTGMEQALSGAFDLILLDVMLAGIDGYEICRQIRSKIDAPILMVTARIEDVDKVRGLGLGADDYIAKPFSPTELVARVKANLAQYERLRSAGGGAGVGVGARVMAGTGAGTGTVPGGHRGSLPESEQEIDLGYLRINPQTRYVYVEGRQVELKNREYELLYFLVSNAEIVFSREHLYERVWGMSAYGDIKTVAVHISRLREKIERDPANPQHLQTVWGAGYRFKR
ncbi:MAG: response regulator transcription factor [Coriobacteriales bacterium]|jgi:DNA-binding response OmpR family regulator|nr:response regulator transcription factor [Coriobacteriales bacterium]